MKVLWAQQGTAGSGLPSTPAGDVRELADLRRALAEARADLLRLRRRQRELEAENDQLRRHLEAVDRPPARGAATAIARRLVV
jgi:cell division protein FtsB